MVARCGLTEGCTDDGKNVNKLVYSSRLDQIFILIFYLFFFVERDFLISGCLRILLLHISGRMGFFFFRYEAAAASATLFGGVNHATQRATLSEAQNYGFKLLPPSLQPTQKSPAAMQGSSDTRFVSPFVRYIPVSFIQHCAPHVQ